MQKLLYIVPHYSTGGQPSYVLKQIEEFKDKFDIMILEAHYAGPDFVVQRNKVKKLVPFIQASGNQDIMRGVIEGFQPDIIHFHEVPEHYLDGGNHTENKGEDILPFIYDENQSFKVLVTSHGSLTRRKDFQYLPDAIVAVSNWQKQLFEKELPEVPVDIWEYPIEDLKPSSEEKKKAKAEIVFELHKRPAITAYCKSIIGEYGTSGYENINVTRHFLNVGLFAPGKNQREIFEIARKNPDNIYHFVGNQAGNFKHYWEPLMKNKPDNCIIWGEREDVDLFYKACDEMYFASIIELNPICVKEALSYGLPITMRRLETYGTDYDNNPLVTFIKEEDVTEVADLQQVDEDTDNYERYFNVKKGDVIVDIGAHIGMFSRKHMEKASVVYAVEPDPLFIKSLMKLNQDKVKVIKAGIAKDNDGSLIESNGSANAIGKGNTKIETITFKDLVKDIPHIDFLKIDCEGAEYDVFTEGNIEWIKNNVDKIAGEFHIHSEEHKKEVKKVLSLFDKHDIKYIITSVDGFKVDLLSRLDFFKEVSFFALTKDNFKN